MDINEIAEALVAGCREGAAKERENLDKLYAPDAVSVEAADMGSGRETHRVAGIHAKHDWWEQSMEMHSVEAIGPMMHGDDRFAVIFRMDGTDKESGERHKMEEVGIYTVKDGKIVREEFFYALGG